VIASKFVLSAASAPDFPTTGLPEIAMVGRSNVGKSTLINALLKQKIARTSAAPGKTRLVNYYLIEETFYLVDLPGYGYARGGPASAETFEVLTQQYFDPDVRPGRRIGGVLHLIDGRHPDLDADQAAHRWLVRTEAAVAVVATKIDKLNRGERVQNLKLLAERYDTTILPVSALDNTGLDDVWKMIRQWSGRDA
jgi:GTP-binding protein